MTLNERNARAARYLAQKQFAAQERKIKVLDAFEFITGVLLVTSGAILITCYFLGV